MSFITRWPANGSEAQRAAFVGQQLGLVGPATADRALPVGSLMPGGVDWSLTEV